MEMTITEEQRSDLERSIQDAMKCFLEAMYDFKEPEFNQPPDAKTWSGAGVCSHIHKSLSYIHQAVNGLASTTARVPDVHRDALRQMMEDMNSKAKSAAVLLPAPDFISRTAMRNELSTVEQLFLSDVQTLDLSLLCEELDFPGLGYLTRYELISFAFFHVRRHTRQLGRIHEALQAKSAMT